MTDVSAAPMAFWDTVAAQVTPALRQKPRDREPIVAYLCDLDSVARRECDSRRTIQIIASGRSLLGDQSGVDPILRRFLRT